MATRLREKGGETIGVSTDSPAELAAQHRKNPGLLVTLASDAKHEAIEALGLVHHTLGKTVAAPANLLIDKSGVVRWAHYSATVTDRVDPEFLMKLVSETPP